MVKTLDAVQGVGLPVQITEFEPQSSGKPITGGWRQGTWTEEAQAECAEQMYRLAFGHPAVEAINWWGFSDRAVWQPGDGLLTAEYEPKPVYRRLERLITQEWRTRTTAQTDANGEIAFRGFYGRYSVELRSADGSTQAFSLLLSKKPGQENRFRFTVR